MHTLPYEHGRLALSTAAMKTVAKTLAHADAMTALMAGLRTHVGHMPFDVNDEPIRDLSIIGDVGSGIAEITHGFLYAAVMTGFRTLLLTTRLNHLQKGDPDDTWSKENGTKRIYFKTDTYAYTRLLDLEHYDDTDCDPSSLTTAFLHTSLDFSGSRQMIIRMPCWQKTDPAQYQHMLSSVLEAVSRYENELGHTVVCFEDINIRESDLKRIRAAAGGLLMTHHAMAAEVDIDDKEMCLFGKCALPDTYDYQAGEFSAGLFKQRHHVSDMQKIKGRYIEKGGHNLEKGLLRALMNMPSKHIVDEMTHTERLNAVAQACGYKNWHAAEGRALVRSL